MSPPTPVWWWSLVGHRSTPEADLHTKAREDLSMIDALSFPVTILYALSKIRRHPSPSSPFHVILIGASSKTEQRVWEVSSGVDLYYCDICPGFHSWKRPCGMKAEGLVAIIGRSGGGTQRGSNQSPVR